MCYYHRDIISPWISYNYPDIPPVHFINVRGQIPKNIRPVQSNKEQETTSENGETGEQADDEEKSSSGM